MGKDVRNPTFFRVETFYVHFDVNIYTVSLNIFVEVPVPVFKILGIYSVPEEILGISLKNNILGDEITEKVTLLIRKNYFLFCFQVSYILNAIVVFFDSISVYIYIILDGSIVYNVN